MSGFSPAEVSTYPLLRYNAYTFPQHLTDSSMETELVYDPAGRTVAGVKHVINAKSRILGTTTTDATALAARRKLQEPRKQLQYTDQGNGSLTVNAPGAAGTMSDMEFGPKPKIIRWKRMGLNLGWEFEWRCETVVSECKPQSIGLLRYFNSKVRYTKDSSGFITREYSGRLAVANNIVSVGGKELTILADDPRFLAYTREWATPAGFKRTAESYELMPGSMEVNWSYTDTELPGPFPKGAVNFTASQRTRMGNTNNVGMGVVTLTATYEMDRTAKPSPGIAAARLFQLMVVSRRNAGLAPGALGAAAIVLQWDAFERIEKSEFTFVLSYTITSSIRTMLKDANHFKPIPFGAAGVGEDDIAELGAENPNPANLGVAMGDAKLSPTAWKTSTPQLHAPIVAPPGINMPTRGTLKFRVDKDTIIDTCFNPGVEGDLGTFKSPQATPQTDPNKKDLKALKSKPGKGKRILGYKSTVDYYVSGGKVVHSMSPQSQEFGSGGQGSGGFSVEGSAGRPPLSTYGGSGGNGQSFGEAEVLGAGGVQTEDPLNVDSDTYNKAVSNLGASLVAPNNGAVSQNINIQVRRGVETYVDHNFDIITALEPAPVPVLRSVAKSGVSELGRRVFVEVKYFFGVPVYHIYGSITYVLLSPPGTMTVDVPPANDPIPVTGGKPVVPH